MPASIINCDNPKDADVALIGANYDVTSSFGKGADKGPAAIVGCLDRQIEFYERFTKTAPADQLKIAYHDLGDLNTLSPEDMVERVASVYEEYLNTDRAPRPYPANRNSLHKNLRWGEAPYRPAERDWCGGKFLILLGGEHSISNGPWQAMAKHEDAKNITILQIDAHLDLRDSDADYNDEPHGKYAHSCVMRRAVELGYNTAHVGIRAYSKDEYDFAKSSKVIIFEWGNGKTPTPQEIMDAIKTDKVYLTIDVDGIDPAFMPATGTPVQGGLEWYYTFQLLRELFQKKNVIAADIVEVAPRAADILTECGAAQLCYTIIANKFLKTKI